MPRSVLTYPVPIGAGRSKTVPNPGHSYSPGWALRNAKPSLCDVKVAAGFFYLSGRRVVPAAN